MLRLVPLQNAQSEPTPNIHGFAILSLRHLLQDELANAELDVVRLVADGDLREPGQVDERQVDDVRGEDLEDDGLRGQGLVLPAHPRRVVPGRWRELGTIGALDCLLRVS